LIIFLRLFELVIPISPIYSTHTQLVLPVDGNDWRMNIKANSKLQPALQDLLLNRLQPIPQVDQLLLPHRINLTAPELPPRLQTTTIHRSLIHHQARWHLMQL
jgi:hypothetical protein